MPNFNIVLDAFGLGNVRAIRYDGKGTELTTGVGGYQAAPQKANFSLNSGAINNQRTSYLGTPVVSDLVLESFNTPLAAPDTVRFDMVLIEVSQTKNIVTTGVVGRNGTIKEYICDGDYEIKIRGAVVSQNAYPEEAVRNFIKILLVPKEIKVISDFLRLFNIYNIVITDYTFGQKEGFKNLQFFEITALSDAPENLIKDDTTNN